MPARLTNFTGRSGTGPSVVGHGDETSGKVLFPFEG